MKSDIRCLAAWQAMGLCNNSASVRAAAKLNEITKLLQPVQPRRRSAPWSLTQSGAGLGGRHTKFRWFMRSLNSGKICAAQDERWPRRQPHSSCKHPTKQDAHLVNRLHPQLKAVHDRDKVRDRLRNCHRRVCLVRAAHAPSLSEPVTYKHLSITEHRIHAAERPARVAHLGLPCSTVAGSPE